MNPKKWLVYLVITTFIVIGLPVFSVMGFNYYIDPLWNFTHANEYNDYQYAFDERQLKTNYINNHNFDYDSLLIGTSRVTYIDETAFKKEKVYNYSLSSLHIEEYLDYMKYAEKKNEKPFKRIYIELYINSYDGDTLQTTSPAETYFDTAEDTFYPITSLFSKNTLDYALENYAASKADYYAGPRSYTRNNIGQTTYPNDQLDFSWNKFKKNFYANADKPFNYDENYKEKIQEIKDAFPNAEIIVFTDLIPAKRFQTVLHNDIRYEAYSRWMNEMVDVFETVYSFHGVNNVTTNMDNFFDWLHFYPQVGDLMIEALENRDEPSEIVQVVNEDNVDSYLAEIVVDIELD